jgi:outer membrane protein assembly factor BamE (lipoprotein component of BamABCDE complex)
MSNQSSKDLPPKRSREGRRNVSVAFVAACLLLTACGGRVIRQGHQFQEEDLKQVRDGMSKEQVTLALGTPDTQSAVSGGAYYYISTTAEQSMAFMRPSVTERHVVAVYFDKQNRVEKIANYGLKDGVVVDFVSRETPSYTRDEGLLKEIFRNIGASPAIPGMNRGG